MAKNKEKVEEKNEVVVVKFKLTDPKVGYFDPVSKKNFTGKKVFTVKPTDPEYPFVTRNLSLAGDKPFTLVKK